MPVNTSVAYRVQLLGGIFMKRRIFLAMVSILSLVLASGAEMSWR